MDNTYNIDLDIEHYSLDDLFSFLNLNINDPTREDISKVIKEMVVEIEESDNNNKEEFKLFLYDVEEKLYDAIPVDNEVGLVNEKNSYNKQNDSDAQLSTWWSEQTLKQDDSVQDDKITKRKQKIDIYDNDHNVMKRQSLGVNQSSSVSVVQGELNPNLKNTTVRLINIDSQFRQNGFPAKNGLKYNDIISPSTSVYSSTDYSLSLTEPLNNVVSLKMYSLSIPFTWYNIDDVYGTNVFAIIDELLGFAYTIKIISGNYLSKTDTGMEENNIFAAINTKLLDSGLQNVGFTIDILTGKAIFINNSGKSLRLLFYTSLGEQVKTSLNTIDTTTNVGSKSNNNLGYTLGFRNSLYINDDIYTSTAKTFTYYTTSNSYTVASTNNYIYAEAIIDLYGPKYLLLIIDDYNQNHLNKGIIAINNSETIAELPSYFDPNIPSVIQTVDENTSDGIYNEYPKYGYIDPTTLNTSNTNTVPKRITKAQQTTINSIVKDRANTTNNKLPSVTNSDIFALIPIKKVSGILPGDGLTEFSGPIQLNERIYFGPVDIEKLSIKLMTDKGNILNLNGNDWSFCLLAESLYQY